MRASRALVAVAARSLADLGDVTLSQYRALILVSARPGIGVSELATSVGVHPTTATRLTDRLVRKGLVLRAGAPQDRRVTTLRLTTRGRRIVERVMRAREAEVRRIIQRMPVDDLGPVIRALETFSDAAGEPAELDVFGWPPAPR